MLQKIQGIKGNWPLKIIFFFVVFSIVLWFVLNWVSVLRFIISALLNVPVKGEVEYISPGLIYIKNFELGRGLKVGEIRLSFFLDRLILNGEIEKFEFYYVYFDSKRFMEDFESEKGREREKHNLPKFSIRKVLVEDLNIKTDEGSDIWVMRTTFSLSMGGKRINLKGINLNSVDVPPEVFISEAIGNLDFDFDTLRLFFLNLSGNVDTLNLKLKDLSIKIPEPSNSPTLYINVSRVDIGDIGAKDLSLKWVSTEKLGKIEFGADSLWYSETFSKNTSGTLDLQGYPEIFVNAVGKMFGGDFEVSVFVDSSQNVLGSAKFFDISPTPNVELTGRANFEVKEGIRVFGYISKFLNQEPDIILENFYFDVKSSDFNVYSYRVYNNFMSIYGWYNLSKEDFYARFSLSKPTKLVKFQNIRVFTFEGEGEVIKEGEEINLKVTKGKAWYVVFDTFRIDEIEAENLYLKSNI
ncbi:MAG: hypothetical protein ACO2O5_08725, partial [Candidatus Caldipriscus sp.]